MSKHFLSHDVEEHREARWLDLFHQQICPVLPILCNMFSYAKYKRQRNPATFISW